MGFVSTYRLIKSLSPFDLYDIITRGVCPDLCIDAKRQVKEMYGERFLNEWITRRDESPKMDLLSLFISDSGITMYTKKERAQELEKEFKSWGLFYEVWSRWYGGDTYIVGFNYQYEAFEVLYKEWARNKKLELMLDGEV